MCQKPREEVVLRVEFDLVVVNSVSRQTAAPRWQKSVTTILKLLTMIPVFGKSSL